MENLPLQALILNCVTHYNFPTHKQAADWIAFPSNRSDIFLIAHENGVRVIDESTGDTIDSSSYIGYAAKLFVSPDDKNLYITTNSGVHTYSITEEGYLQWVGYVSAPGI